MTTFRISQNGNVIDLSGGNMSISYSVNGVELPELTDMSFAVWHLLPLAMRSGSTIHIDGPVDPLTCENAERMSRTWEMWRPADFKAVKVTALAPLPRSGNRQDEVFMFSGGVDSSYMLLTRGRRQTPGDVFKSAGFAADLSREQDLVMFPWSLNHVTNSYFKSRDFSCSAVDDDVTRAQKVQALAGNPVALSSVSFCVDKSVRPLNCGKCRKCVRTKAMFVGMTGSIPDGVFLDASPPVVSGSDMLGDERVFLIDLFQRTRENGRLRDVTGLEDAMKALWRHHRWRKRFGRMFGRRER